MDTRNGKIYPTPGDAPADARPHLRQMMTEPTPRQRHEMRIGRNDLCPCGSGKKFKSCCLAIVRE